MRKDLTTPPSATLHRLFGPDQAQGLEWAEPRGQSDGLSFEMLLRILREHWKIVVAGAVIGAALAILLTLLTTPMYRAGAVLEVNPPKVEVMEDQDRSTGAQKIGTWDFIATQVGLLKSHSLGERVAQDLNLATNPAFVPQVGTTEQRIQAAGAKVAAGLEVAMPKEGQLIRYSFKSDDPQMAANVANGIADSFIDSSLQRRYDASNFARKFLQRQINKTRLDLENSERALVGYAQAQGIINTASGEDANSGSDANSLQGASLVALNDALAEATAKRIQAEGALRQSGLASAAGAVQSTAGLRTVLAGVEAEYQEKRAQLKPEHPDMIALKNRIDELNRQISAEQSRVSGGQATGLLAAYRAAVSAENALRARVNQLRSSVLDLRGRSIQYNILQRDVDTNRSLYDALLQRYKEVGVAGGIGDSPVSIVDRAQVPDVPYKPNPVLNLMLGIGIGLLAGVALAVALELLNDVIKTRQDVREKLGQACLGVVPRRTESGSILSDLADSGSGVAEAYSAILASLRFTTDHGAPKSLLLTSSGPAEGKSSSAFAIAQNYARRGERVLLIDADLRRPAFKSGTKSGLTTLLTAEGQLRDHLHETEFENLWLLPCGPIPPNPADLLSTQRFGAILKEAKEHFDRILIDGPPLIGLADSVLLASAAENVLMIVESGRTRTKAAREAIERVKGANAYIVGVVLTKSTEEASGYGYSYRYRYGALEKDNDRAILISQRGE